MKEIIITICLLFSYIIVYATEPVTTKVKESKESNSRVQFPPSYYKLKNIYQDWGYFIDASPGISTIKNKNLSSDFWNSESNLGYNFSLGYFHSIGPWVKVKLGVGFSNYSTGTTGNGEIISPQMRDIDNDTYTESLTLSNADFNANPMYFTVPLTFEFGTANVNKLGYYIDFGIEYSYLINENNKSAGTYSTKGMYPQWGLTLEDIPELGFYTSKNIETDWSMQKSNFSLRGGAGITIPISGVVIFKLGLTGNMGLKDIGNKQAKVTDFGPISQQAYEFRSMYINNPLATSKGSKILYTGIEFGFYISKQVK